MKRRPVEQTPGQLPTDIAAGPLVEVWAPDYVSKYPMTRLETAEARLCAARSAWMDAGEKWNEQNGLRLRGWLSLLSPEVRFAWSSLGRAKARAELRARFERQGRT